MAKDTCNDFCMTFFLSCFRQSNWLGPAAQQALGRFARSNTPRVRDYTALAVAIVHTPHLWSPCSLYRKCGANSFSDAAIFLHAKYPPSQVFSPPEYSLHAD